MLNCGLFRINCGLFRMVNPQAFRHWLSATTRVRLLDRFQRWLKLSKNIWVVSQGIWAQVPTQKSHGAFVTVLDFWANQDFTRVSRCPLGSEHIFSSEHSTFIFHIFGVSIAFSSWQFGVSIALAVGNSGCPIALAVGTRFNTGLTIQDEHKLFKNFERKDQADTIGFDTTDVSRFFRWFTHNLSRGMSEFGPRVLGPHLTFWFTRRRRRHSTSAVTRIQHQSERFFAVVPPYWNIREMRWAVTLGFQGNLLSAMG